HPPFTPSPNPTLNSHPLLLPPNRINVTSSPQSKAFRTPTPTTHHPLPLSISLFLSLSLPLSLSLFLSLSGRLMLFLPPVCLSYKILKRRSGYIFPVTPGRSCPEPKSTGWSP